MQAAESSLAAEAPSGHPHVPSAQIMLTAESYLGRAIEILAALFIIGPAYEFASEEIDVTTPALELSNAWRAAALPVGIALMALTAVIQLVSVGKWKLILVGVGTVVVVAAALAALGPVLRGLGN